MTGPHKGNDYMNNKTGMTKRKTIALIAHDDKKRDLLEWAKFNLDVLRRHKICATGATGVLLAGELGPFTYRSGLEHPRGMQPVLSGFYDLILADGCPL